MLDEDGGVLCTLPFWLPSPGPNQFSKESSVRDVVKIQKVVPGIDNSLNSGYARLNVPCNPARALTQGRMS